MSLIISTYACSSLLGDPGFGDPGNTKDKCASFILALSRRRFVARHDVCLSVRPSFAYRLSSSGSSGGAIDTALRDVIARSSFEKRIAGLGTLDVPLFSGTVSSPIAGLRNRGPFIASMALLGDGSNLLFDFATPGPLTETASVIEAVRPTGNAVSAEDTVPGSPGPVAFIIAASMLASRFP
jgi:hypothetical protein